MAAEPERAYLKAVGNSDPEWDKTVDKMSDEKVIEVYLSTKAYLDEKNSKEAS